MEKYIDIQRMKDRNHAYSKLIQEDIAFIKSTQGQIMSSKPNSFRDYYHYLRPILELLLDIELRRFRTELKQKALQSDVSVKKKREMLGTEMEEEMEMRVMRVESKMGMGRGEISVREKVTDREMERKMERVMEIREKEKGMKERYSRERERVMETREKEKGMKERYRREREVMMEMER